MPGTATGSVPSAVRAAYIDVDGTLSRTNIVGPLVFFRRRLMRPGLRELWMLSLLPRGLYWFLLDKLSREASNRSIYACYGGLEASRVRGLAEDCYREFWKPRLFPDGLRRLERLKSEGVRLVLVTGSIDFLIEPLAREVGAESIAPGLEEADGRFTGRLLGPPLTGQRKVELLREHADKHGVALKESFSFGDAAGDLPMLECVGHPVAVNPGRRLTAAARARGWPIEQWRL